MTQENEQQQQSQDPNIEFSQNPLMQGIQKFLALCAGYLESFKFGAFAKGIEAGREGGLLAGMQGFGAGIVDMFQHHADAQGFGAPEVDATQERMIVSTNLDSERNPDLDNQPKQDELGNLSPGNTPREAELTAQAQKPDASRSPG